MSNLELAETTWIRLETGNEIKQSSKRCVRKAKPALNDTVRELRKKEASKPLYLVRYE